MAWFRRKKSAESADEEQSSTQRAYSLLERHKLGYRSVRSTPLRTLEGDNYRQFVESPDAWQRLEQRMNAYFNYAIEIFPYRNQSGLHKVTLKRPKRFFTIQREMIETCFPGGRTHGEPGDSDLRDLLAALQLTFRHNLRHYYVVKRLICELLAVVLIACVFLAYTHGSVQSFGEQVSRNLDGSFALSIHWLAAALFVCAILAIFALSWFVNWLLHTLLLGALNVSCLFVDGQAAIRTKNLINLVDDIFPRIDSDRYILEKTAHQKEWPERSKKWAVLIYWLAKRLEYIERFVQVETWLMRREHYWMNRTALGVFCTIALAWLAAMIWIGAGMGMGSAPMHTPGNVIAYFFAVAAGCAVLWISYTKWSTPLTLIEDKLQPANWMRYRDVHLQEKFAKQIARDQSEILEKEDQLAGH